MFGEGGEKPALPPGWAWAVLDDLGYWSGGGTPSKRNEEFWADGSIPWVSPKDMKADYVGEDAEKINERAVEHSAVKLVEAGSVIIVVRSGILRHTVPVSIADRTVTLNQDLRALTPFADVSPRYIQFYLRSQNRRILAECSKHGTTVNSINVERLGQFEIPLPPANEQRRIVARIEELFGEIEAGEQELEKAREGLADFRRAVLKAAVTGELTREWREKNPPNETGADFLARILAERRAAWERAELARLKAKGKAPKGDSWKSRYVEPTPPDTSGLRDLPNGWVWASVDQLSELIQYGTSAKCSGDPSGIPVLRMGNIQDGCLDYSELKYLPHGHAAFPELLLKAGDLLFNRTNSAELVGKTAVYDGSVVPCSFASYLIRIRPIGIFPEYLCHYLNSIFGKAWVASVKSQQVGQANVSGGKLKKLAIPLPPEQEQQEIVRVAEMACEAMRELECEEVLWSSAARLRQSTLAIAFSGKLVPQDPADEPASVLLERLRAIGVAMPVRRSGRSVKANLKAPRRSRSRSRKKLDPAEETLS